MSSIVVSVINFIAGTVLNKACDYTAKKLKEGDVTDDRCRELIVRELDEIKSKLDGLARKDLLSSVCFLSDGVCLLGMSFEKSSDDKATFTQEEQREMTEGEASFVVECEGSMNSESSACKETLAISQATLTIASRKRFLSANSSFEKAYTKATEAFNNEALSTEDRILATKLRVVSKILECLEDPEAAVAFCKLYIQQLHEMPSIKKTFAVYLRHKGMRSRIRKTKRIKNVQLVMKINYVLLDYIKTFTNTEMDNIFNWPQLKLPRKSLHPLVLENEMLQSVEKSGAHSPNQFRFSESREQCPEHVAVNSRGVMIIKNKEGEYLDVVNCNGEIKLSFVPTKGDKNGGDFGIVALTTDDNDDVYIVSRFKLIKEFHYNLSVVDPNGNIKQEFPLECLTGPGESHHSVCIAVRKDQTIFVSKQDEARICVFNNHGQLKRTFLIDGWHLIKYLSISDQNEIIAGELVGKTVSIYTEEGKFKRNIEIPELHKVCGLTFNHITRTIIVLTEVMPGCPSDYQLTSYSEDGDQLQTLLLPEQKANGIYKLVSHSKGPFAVVHKTGVTFIQY